MSQAKPNDVKQLRNRRETDTSTGGDDFDSFDDDVCSNSRAVDSFDAIHKVLSKVDNQRLNNIKSVKSPTARHVIIIELLGILLDYEPCSVPKKEQNKVMSMYRKTPSEVDSILGNYNGTWFLGNITKGNYFASFVKNRPSEFYKTHSRKISINLEQRVNYRDRNLLEEVHRMFTALGGDDAEGVFHLAASQYKAMCPNRDMPLMELFQVLNQHFLILTSLSNSSSSKAILEEVERISTLMKDEESQSKALLVNKFKFVPPLQTASGIALSKWVAANQNKTIENIQCDTPDVRDSLNQMIQLIVKLLHREIVKAKANSDLILSEMKRLSSRFNSSYFSALRTVQSDADYHAFTVRASEIQEQCRNKLAGGNVRQSDSDLIDLYLHSRLVKPKFESFSQWITDQLQKQGAKVECILAQEKSMLRALEKSVIRRTEELRGSAACLLDVVRAAINFYPPNGMGMMLMALEFIATSRDIKIVRVKDRYRSPTPNGWCDCLINFYFLNDAHKHVCELQLVHNNMMLVRSNMAAHDTYDLFRAGIDLLDANGLDTATSTTTEEGSQPQPHSGEALEAAMQRLEQRLVQRFEERIAACEAKLLGRMDALLDRLDSLSK